MNRIIFIGFFLFLPFTLKLQAQRTCDFERIRIERSFSCPEYYFVPTFRDDFNDATLNLSKWKVIEGVVRDPYHTIEKQWYSAQNIELRDGYLYLFAKKNVQKQKSYSIWLKDGMKGFQESFNYSSAEINSKQKFKYGKYEIRCKLPKGKGFFPAFWMFGSPPWNEIDVFEFWNEKRANGEIKSKLLSRKHKMNIHYDYDGDGISNNCPSSYKGPDFSEDFHTFTLIWTPYRLEWYVDGEFKRASNLYQKGRKTDLDCKDLKAGKRYRRNRIFPDVEVNIIANLAIQSDANAPNENTPLPSALIIDYISYEAMVENNKSKQNSKVKSIEIKP